MATWKIVTWDDGGGMTMGGDGKVDMYLSTDWYVLRRHAITNFNNVVINDVGKSTW